MDRRRAVEPVGDTASILNAPALDYDAIVSNDHPVGCNPDLAADAPATVCDSQTASAIAPHEHGRLHASARFPDLAASTTPPPLAHSPRKAAL
ncbi:hypothetical protein WBP07_27980 [Novosphingobium sp. BL-8A]|uniref:hypothetical protein n=1 Tax=Novosphingobium sp. BL-8A TaxID=3127639 RepID=UPI003757C4D3